MKKSAILTKAGENLLSDSNPHIQLKQKTEENNNNKIDQKTAKQEQQNITVYMKQSSIINKNSLQQLDDEYQQIKAIQTKFIDQNGLEVKSKFDGKQKGNVQNTKNAKKDTKYDNRKKQIMIVKKDDKSKNMFVNQSILEVEDEHQRQNIHLQSSHQRHNQTQLQSPEARQIINSSIKNNTQLPLSSSKFEPSPQKHPNPKSNAFDSLNKLFQNKNKKQYANQNSTLLKNYPKLINKMQNEHAEMQNIKQKYSPSSYISNQNGFTEKDFYKFDYKSTNNNNYSLRSNNKLGLNLYNSKVSQQTANFFSSNSTQNQLHQIEDILSDINSLNNNNNNSNYLDYSSGKIFSKNQSLIMNQSAVGKKYKGSKISSSFNKVSARNDFMPDRYKLSKLDQLLYGYQFSYESLNTMETSKLHLEKSQQNKDKALSQSKMSVSQVTDLKSKLQERRKQRQERRKNNKYYEQVKDQLKYGIDSNMNSHHQQNRLQMHSNPNQYRQHPKSTQFAQHQQIQVDLKNEESDDLKSVISKNNTYLKQKRINLSGFQSARKANQSENKQEQQILELAQSVRFFQIQWNQLPIIPVENQNRLKETKIQNKLKEPKNQNKSKKSSQVRQLTAINKLNTLKDIFESIDKKNKSKKQYRFGLIPSIISEQTTQEQQNAIKNYLRDNFRGGIYYLSSEKEDNLCVLELCNNSELRIEQVSTQHRKEVVVNDNFVIKILPNQTYIKGKENLPKQSQSNKFVVGISLLKNSQSVEEINNSNKRSYPFVEMNCRYNQIQYPFTQIEKNINNS